MRPSRKACAVAKSGTSLEFVGRLIALAPARQSIVGRGERSRCRQSWQCLHGLLGGLRGLAFGGSGHRSTSS